MKKENNNIVEDISNNMSIPSTPEEWERYYETVKEAEKLKEQGIDVNYA